MQGRRAHSARSWLGENAVHAAAPLLAALARYVPRQVDIDGCPYREGLNAVRIEGGVAGNVVPDACTVTVNFRFAPDRTEAAGAGARARGPGAVRVRAHRHLARRAAGAGGAGGAALPRSVGGEPVAKLGWTDVARFAALASRP